MTTGLYIGRFQPVHKGHILSIKSILEQVDDLAVVVGSALNSYSLENPFTAGERIKMLRDAFVEAGIPLSRVIILAVPDTLPPNYHSIYVSQVETYCPRFDVVFTHNPLVKTLFQKAGYDVREHETFDRDRYCGTTIRERMLNGKDWKELVPPSVARYIEELDGVGRLKQLSASDKPQP